MSEFKYIRKVAEAYPYDYEEPPICKVELWDFSRANECEEARIETVATVASVSYGNEQAKDPEKLYRVLIEKGHESPFEFVKDYVGSKVYDLRNAPGIESVVPCAKVNRMGFATYKLKVPIFVARQIMRHRAFSYMEMSRRYVTDKKVELEFWEFNRTMRWCVEDYYKTLLKNGLKPEKARAILPFALYTQFWMQGDYKAWLNFFIHRLAPETQAETRLVAEAMWRLLKEHQPEIIKMMHEYLDRWVAEGGGLFQPSRDKKAMWFRENYLA